jgi:hypothetical protein
MFAQYRTDPFRNPLAHVQGILGLPQFARFKDDDDEDGKGGSGGGKPAEVSMSQSAFDKIVIDAKEQAKRAAERDVEESLGMSVDQAKAKLADAAKGDDQRSAEIAAIEKDRDEWKAKAEGLEADKAEADKAKARDALVAKVAQETKLPDNLAEFLTGDDEEALTASAKKLMEATGAGSGGDEGEGEKKPPVPKGGTNRGAQEKLQPEGLSEAIHDHYEGGK